MAYYILSYVTISPILCHKNTEVVIGELKFKETNQIKQNSSYK